MSYMRTCAPPLPFLNHQWSWSSRLVCYSWMIRLKMFSLICSFRWTILSLPISASLQTMVTTTSTSPTNKSASSSPINTSQYLDLPSESFRADVGECSYCFSISSVGTCKLKRLWIMGLLSTGSGMGERAEVGVTWRKFYKREADALCL